MTYVFREGMKARITSPEGVYDEARDKVLTLEERWHDGVRCIWNVDFEGRREGYRFSVWEEDLTPVNVTIIEGVVAYDYSAQEWSLGEVPLVHVTVECAKFEGKRVRITIEEVE